MPVSFIFLLVSQSLFNYVHFESVMLSRTTLPLPLPPLLQFFQHHCLPVSRFCTEGRKWLSLKFSPPKNIFKWFPLGLTGWPLCCPCGLLKRALLHHHAYSEITAFKISSAFFLQRQKPCNPAFKQDFLREDMWVSCIIRALAIIQI